MSRGRAHKRRPMSNSIIIGPLLGFEDGDFYTVCILLEAGSASPELKLPGLKKTAPFTKAGVVGGREFWRAEFPVPVAAKGTNVDYSVQVGAAALADRHARVKWRFYVPGTGEEPVIAYASCNGFSSAKLMMNTAQPYAVWERMKDTHKAAPFSLLLMGGDQVYADEIWESKACPLLREWSKLDETAQFKTKVSAQMKAEVAAFYDGLYVDRWENEAMSEMYASIPSVMMWDDHDIFDGWGSYPDLRQGCYVFQAIFKEASRVYDVLQLRCSPRNRMSPRADHRTLRFSFRNYLVLALDNRSERKMDTIMSQQNWDDVKAWLDQLQGTSVANLLVMTGVPVVYRSFAKIEATMDGTFWHEELEDDVHDHWSSRPHLAERMKLVMVLMNFLKSHAGCKAVLLSGDVHVGALGQLWDERQALGLTQIISSGIVHPPPSAFAWAGIQMMTNDTPEALGDGEIVAEMLTPFGSSRYLRTRNFAMLHTGTDKKLWVNWICENEKLKPSFAIS